jgi:hypothetical protein
MAVNFAPERPACREALFNFLLDNADCSRAALREAAGIFSGMAVSDPEYDWMRGRLEQAMNCVQGSMRGSPESSWYCRGRRYAQRLCPERHSH